MKKLCLGLVVAASLMASTALAAPVKLAAGRCPVKPPPQLDFKRLPDGDFLLTARFTLKADGTIEHIAVEGKSPESFRRAIAESIRRYECLPAEADQEIESEFRIKIS